MRRNSANAWPGIETLVGDRLKQFEADPSVGPKYQ